METDGHPKDPEDLMSMDARPQYPRSYTENTPEEQHLLFIAQSFQRHFSLLYPDRRPLLLCPTNECGVKKLVTTTLRPTMPGLADLCTWQQCARFVSNYLALQPLEPPTELPSSLRSPQAVLLSQKCTSLEYANLLCSLLLGLNYNAYCVSGYASKHLCELDRTQESYPLHEEQPEDPVEEAQDEGNKKLHSKFILKQEKKLQQQGHPKIHTEPPPTPDPLWGLRVHFWVLVLAGSGSIEQDFFIEPLSGNPFPTKHPHFLGVESLWNELNVYVNMQDCVKGCQDMLWDPEDQIHWEPLVYGTTSRKQLQAEAHMIKMNLQDDPEEETGPPYSYDMPLSWCSMIHITDTELEMCWPGGFKVTHFKQALVENFIPFFCRDGVVTRLTLYQDTHKTQVQAVREWFQHRADRLMERETRGSFTTERFKPGRSGHLILTPEREMHFEAYRVDGLVRRLEQGYHMIETFEKRRDFLFQRHTLFDCSTERKDNVYGDRKEHEDSRPILKVVEQFHRDPSKDASEDIAERAFLLAERRIEVTYHLKDSTFIPAKRSFDKPTESTKTQKAGDFSRDMVSTFQPDPQGEPFKLHQLQQLLVTLMKEEQRTISQIRSTQRSVQSLVQSRAEEEQDVRLETSPWTTSGTSLAQKHRERAMLLGEELRWLEQQQKELLAPVLMRLNGSTELRPDQAQTVYENCLQDFKNRIVQHASLIQQRIHQDTPQEWPQSDRCTDSDLKDCNKRRQIHVAQKRLQMHKECARHKYFALEQQLRADPRIGPHLKDTALSSL